MNQFQVARLRRFAAELLLDLRASTGARRYQIITKITGFTLALYAICEAETTRTAVSIEKALTNATNTYYMRLPK